MSIFKLPPGCELAILVYLIGTSPDTKTTVSVRVMLNGLTRFSDEFNEQIDVPRLVTAFGLIGSFGGMVWRVMTSEEIKDYKDGEE